MTDQIKKVASDMREKNANYWARMVLRVLAGGVLAVMAVWRIAIPVIAGNKIEIDAVDGKIMVISMAMLIAIEAVKAAIQNILKNRAK